MSNKRYFILSLSGEWFVLDRQNENWCRVFTSYGEAQAERDRLNKKEQDND